MQKRLDIRSISRDRKKKFLKSFDEDGFRDECVRPLLERLGYKFERDTCGASEEGKDCIFTSKDPLGQLSILAVQTKKGDLKSAGTSVDTNVATAISQIRLMLDFSITLSEPKLKSKPHQVMLIASGVISEPARKYIFEIDDPRIKVQDSENLIPLIDEHFPEFWLGVDKSLFPYLRGLTEKLVNANDVITWQDDATPPILDESYTPTYVTRMLVRAVRNTTYRTVRANGKQLRLPHTFTDVEPRIEQYEASNILQRTRESRILILGEGGSGKTTLLRRIVFKLASDALRTGECSHIPVILSASSVAKDSSHLLDCITDAVRKAGNQNECPFSLKDISDGKILVLIDSLDELGDSTRVKQVVGRVHEFQTKYPKSRIVLTSREYGFVTRVPELSSYVQYKLAPLSLASAAKIINRRYKKIDDEHKRRLANEVLRRMKDVHGLELTPMIVTVFMQSDDFNRRDIPPNITEIFKKYTEEMLGRWDRTRGISTQFVPDFKDRLLQRVAFSMQLEGIISLDKFRFESMIREELSQRDFPESWQSLIEDLLGRSNLLSEEFGKVSFRHPLLREFFAGRAVRSAKDFEDKVAQDWWRRSVIFYFGENPDRYDELEQLMKFSESLPLDGLYEAAITLGLAAQACYWAKTEERVSGLRWVIQALALSLREYVSISSVGSTYKTFPFINAYLRARDAVGCSFVEHISSDVIPQERPEVSKDDVTVLEQFWTIVGLLENGAAKASFDAIKVFNTDDLFLLLALDIGAHYIETLRVSSAEEIRWAKKIRHYLSDKIKPAKQELFKEFTTELLEIRGGAIVEVEVEPDPPGKVIEAEQITDTSDAAD